MARPMAGRPSFTIDMANERLWRDGKIVRVKKKVFQLLTFLVENPQRLLTKDSILAQVWPDTHVTDASVKDCVKNLRLILQDNARKPVFVETVRGRGYRYLGGIEVRGSGGEENSLYDAFASHQERPAVAILPFENLSGDPDQDYLSEGLAEDIITLLAAWRSFPVVARNSSFAFKGSSCDIRQIARELSATYIIQGSVQVSGDRLRVSAQLVDGLSGHNLWTRKFDNKADRLVHRTGTGRTGIQSDQNDAIF